MHPEPLRSIPTRLHVRAPGHPQSLRALLACACPGLDDARFARWVADGAVRLAAGRAASKRDLDAPLAAGVAVEVELPDPAPTADAWPALRGDEGMAFVRTPRAPWARGALPAPASGDALGDTDVSFERLGEDGGVSELAVRWSVPHGTVGADDPPERPGSADAAFGLARCVLSRLAAGGLCVLGDPFHGGIARPGGPAWRTASAGPHAGEGDAGDDSPYVAAAPGAARPAWTISEATAKVLRRGHPWIRLDADTQDPTPFAPGARVDLVTRDGASCGQALVEGAGRSGVLALRPGDVAGRVVRAPRAGARGGGAKGETRGRRATGEWSIEACVARAVERRSGLVADRAATDAFRLVHGEADGLPGLHVDRLGSLVRVLVTARCAQPLVERVLVALGAAGPDVVPDPWRVIEVVHLDEQVPGRFERVRVHPFSADPAGAAELGREARVRERGLVFRVEPGLADPERSAPGYGLFLDQRENRARTAGWVAAASGSGSGGRFANLFAHTGAFSVALLAAGAGEVVSVDLSGAALRRLEANLAANAGAGVDARRHTSVRRDGRRWLETLPRDARFDGIVLDPPTAAAAGRRFFSVRRDAVPMIAACLAHLAPGGRLLVTLNDRKARRGLAGAIDAAARASGVVLGPVEPAPPSRDFPHLDGFDEGDPFGGFFVEVRA